MVRLGECVSKVDTWNPIKSDACDSFQYIDLSSVDKDKKQIDHSNVSVIEPHCAPSRARQIVKTGDVLVSTVRPNLNGVALVTETFNGATASTGYCVLRSKAEKLDSSYLFYWVQTDCFISDMVKKATGATYPAVSDKTIFDSEIPLPPLAEQKRIAAILDKADAIRRKRNQSIQLADDLLRSIFMDMFGDPVTNPKGWEVKPLGEITTFENGDRSSNYPSGDDIVQSGVLFLNTKNIVADTLDLSATQFITEDKYKMLTRGKAQKGDLIITLRGTLGACCIFDCDYEKAFINAQMMIIRTGDKVMSGFLHDMLVSNTIKSHFQRIGQGAAVPQLTAKQLKELSVPLPAIDVQVKYEAVRKFVLSTLDKLYFAADQSLFESLCNKAFSGQI